MVAILYNFNLDYFISNINDSYWNFINIASNLSDVINANVAQIYIGPINQNKKKITKRCIFFTAYDRYPYEIWTHVYICRYVDLSFLKYVFSIIDRLFPLIP